MDFAKIKYFIRKNGDKFILIENGEPELVVMSFREYEKLANGSHAIGQEPAREREDQEASGMAVEGSRFSEGEGDILRETEFIPSGAIGKSPHKHVRPEHIRLEDLPI